MSIYLSGAIVMHRRAGYATVPVSRKREGEEGVGGAGRRRRRALGFSFRVQLYRARQRGRGEGLNMHDAWALKPAFLRVVHHPRAPRMQIAGHRRYRFRHLERRSLPIPAKLRAREFFSLIFLPPPFFPILLLFFFLIVVLYLSIYLFFFSRSILSRASYSGSEHAKRVQVEQRFGRGVRGWVFFELSKNPWGLRGEKRGCKLILAWITIRIVLVWISVDWTVAGTLVEHCTVSMVCGNVCGKNWKCPVNERNLYRWYML